MPITNKVFFVLALLGFLLLTVNAQQSSRLIFDELTTPGAFQSLPFRGNASAYPNAPGQTTVKIEAYIPFELCITEGFVLEPPYTGCDPQYYFSSNSSSASPFSSLETFDSDSSLGIRDDYYETSRSFYPLTEQINSNYTLAMYLRNGSNYFVNVHSLSTTMNNSNAIYVYSSWYYNNCPSYQAANPNGNCDNYGTILWTGSGSSSGSNISSTNTFNGLNYAVFQVQVAPNTAYLSFNYSLTNTTVGATSPAFFRLRRGSSPWIFPGTADANLNTTMNFTATSGLSSGSVGMVVTPLPGIWYVSVFLNFQEVGFSLVANSLVCTNNTAGVNCSSAVQTVSNSTAFQVTGSGDYQYFQITTSNLVVGTGIKNLKTYAPPLLASSLGWPSNSSYQAISNNNTAGSVNLINIANFDYAASPSPAVSSWYVAVWAPSGYKYYIWSNTTCCNNCVDPSQKNPSNKTQGTCHNGYCVCPKHYGGLWCYHTGLAVVWIVLIVIACAIVLAIAIGVPVALYLRNRGKARYERV